MEDVDFVQTTNSLRRDSADLASASAMAAAAQFLDSRPRVVGSCSWPSLSMCWGSVMDSILGHCPLESGFFCSWE